MTTLLYFILFPPLLGFLINSLISLLFKRGSGLSKTISTAVDDSKTFEWAVGLFSTVIGCIVPFAAATALLIMFEPTTSAVVSVMNWMTVGTFVVDFSYYFDSLSVIMLLIVTGVGGVIHFFAIGYMQRERDFARFFSYFNLFIFSMLNLILGENLVITFLGWEGVGLCSYLLISFWYDRSFEGVHIHSTVDAANKAFIMNRVGDAAFIIAMGFLFVNTGSLRFQSILNTPFAPDVLFVVTALFFFACTGKSAQFPLFTWLPDAMAGPTPVSALIHAATMVTSGLFLMARLSPLFLHSPEVSFFVLSIGLFTAIFAAVIAFVQTDIKKILAYSTISQLGFMFMAVGVGASHLAIFHVVTHAYFKACLFLGSGSVINGLRGEQDVRKMGGLWKRMPVTAVTFFVASLALAGIPLTSGFFSKDAIVVSLFASNHLLFYGIAVLVAGLTAAYSMKLFVLVFWGNPRSENVLHTHESSSMTIPLVILALLAVFGGLIGLPETVVETSFVEKWLLNGSVFVNPNIQKLSHSLEWTLMGVSSGIAILGAFAGFVIAKKEALKIESGIEIGTLPNLKGFTRVVYQKFYIDEIYHLVVVIGLGGLLRLLFRGTEAIISMINPIIGFLFNLISGFVSKLQTGNVQNYAVTLIIGIVILVWFVFIAEP